MRPIDERLRRACSRASVSLPAARPRTPTSRRRCTPSSPSGPRSAYEQLFFDWYGGAASADRAAAGPAAASYGGEELTNLRQQLERYTALAPERLGSAYFQRPAPCTLLIDEIEEIWSAITNSDDWSRFETKIEEIRKMRAAYAPSPEGRVGLRRHDGAPRGGQAVSRRPEERSVIEERRPFTRRNGKR